MPAKLAPQTHKVPAHSRQTSGFIWRDGTGVALALAKIVNGVVIISNLLIVVLILSLLLIVMSSMLGSSRTLYQASVDGWLPRYLSRVNQHGAPTAAMWTDLVFNLILLLTSDYFAVSMVSNVCCLVFNFLNLQAGWIHRLARPNWPRPFRAPTWLSLLGGMLGYVNMAFVGAGADVWGRGTLRNGLVAIALILPVFMFRHYVQDKGRFPSWNNQQDVAAPGDDRRVGRGGILPHLAIALVALGVWVTHHLRVRSHFPRSDAASDNDRLSFRGRGKGRLRFEYHAVHAVDREPLSEAVRKERCVSRRRLTRNRRT
jgi:amino acid transporter